MSRPDLSIVVPLHNEEENLPRLYDEVVAALAGHPATWELILVDDGSRDSTAEIADRLAMSDGRLVFVKLRRNYGQTPAMQAGFDAAHGAVIITMDGDLQNDPADIPRFLAKMEEGYDVVCGWRRDRKDKLLLRKVPSWAANRLLQWITGVYIHDSGCSLKSYRAELIRDAGLYSDMHRFIPAIVSMSGARMTEIVTHHRAREFGATKYGISRVWKVMADLWMIKMVVGSISRPGRWFGVLGVPWLLLAGVGAAVAVHGYLTTDASMIIPVAVATLGAFAFLHVVLIGVISELILKTGDFRDRDVIRPWPDQRTREVE